MTRFEQKKIEMEFHRFTRMNFESPTECRSLGQLQYYIHELSDKIKELKSAFNYVPNHAYVLLNQYNQKQNRLIFSNFQEIYS